MKVLVLSPHTDDEVLGAGGTITRFVEEGHEVYCYAFTNCGNESLTHEFTKAVHSLGSASITEEDQKKYQKVRMFKENRQAILDNMLGIKSWCKPDLVLVPSTRDIHQDHQVITQEALRAFKHCSILGYEMPWNNYAFESDYFVRISEEHLQKKINAVKQYKSQSHRPYCNPEYLKGHAMVRGIQVNSQYAETFQLIRWIH